MPEIAVLTMPVSLNQHQMNERSGDVTNIMNRALAYSPFSFSSPRPQGRAEPSPRLIRTTPIDPAGIDVLLRLI